MLSSIPRDETGGPPSRSAAAAAAFFAVGLLSVALLLGRSTTGSVEQATLAGTGTVKIDGRTYPFSPKICVITDDGFVASGPGSWGGQSFIASVSKMGGVEVAFGVRNDFDRPEPDQVWWSSAKLGRSKVEGTTLHATATVEDQSGTMPGVRTAVVHVTCPEQP